MLCFSGFELYSRWVLLITVKHTLSMKRKRLWKTALNLAMAKSYVSL